VEALPVFFILSYVVLVVVYFFVTRKLCNVIIS